MSDYHFELTPEPLHLKVSDLPSDVAEQIRDAQTQNPEFLKNILVYGITHKAVFETLSRAWRR
ncbi:MAG: hypothetical protein GEU90_10020 [Gemmatimonas sp.]|nr:hypothetical protein [Gemmatimonas sp.]